MDHDIIGGSYGGMAAALQLLRARKSVLILDVGRRRNRFASHSHGFLGQDGADPEETARIARNQLDAYPTLTWFDGEAVSAKGEQDRFEVETSDGQRHRGRRILFATGVSDRLPQIEGLAERWGRSVFHCPYCHCYELDRGRIGVIGTGPMSAHQAELLTEWGEVTFLPNRTLTVEPEVRRNLEVRGITIEETVIERIENDADLRVSDGRSLAFAGLFMAPTIDLASGLPARIGCKIDETPMGRQIRTDAAKATSVPGIFACGDAARLPSSISLAVGDGAMAGAQVHRSLVLPEAAA